MRTHICQLGNNGPSEPQPPLCTQVLCGYRKLSERAKAPSYVYLRHTLGGPKEDEKRRC